MQQLQRDLVYFEEQLSENPDDPDLNYNIAQVYFLMGKLDPAIKHLEKTVMLAPGDFEAVLNLASTYRKIGKLADARDVLLRGTQLIATNPHLLYELGVVHSDLANYQSAINAFNKAMQFSTEEGQKQRIIYYIGLAQLTDRNFAGFKATLDQLSKTSEYYQPLKNLGSLTGQKF